MQAGPDALDVRNLGAAQAKRVACTRLSPFGRVGMAGRRPNRDRQRRCQHQTELEIPGPDGKHASLQALVRETAKDLGLSTKEIHEAPSSVMPKSQIPGSSARLSGDEQPNGDVGQNPIGS
jgi:hypothetical protein